MHEEQLGVLVIRIYVRYTGLNVPALACPLQCSATTGTRQGKRSMDHGIQYNRKVMQGRKDSSKT